MDHLNASEAQEGNVQVSVDRLSIKVETLHKLVTDVYSKCAPILKEENGMMEAHSQKESHLKSSPIRETLDEIYLRLMQLETRLLDFLDRTDL